MLSFKSFISKQTIFEGMPSTLENFLHHLSSPSFHEYSGSKKLSETKNLQEVDVTNLAKRLAGDKMTKTQGVYDKAKGMLPAGTTPYKHMRAGVRKASSEIPHEDEKTRRAKVSEARKVYDSFSQERGFKKGPDLFIENGKTEKSSGVGIHTKGLSLAPHTAGGVEKFDVCPKASHSCRANCLGTEAGGNRQYADTALSSKAIKTNFLAAHPEHFTRLLDHEIRAHVRSTEKSGYRPDVRLNVTSDLDWADMAGPLIKHHSNVSSYDYSKDPNKVERQFHPDHPKNYKLALSHTGDGEESNSAHAANLLEKGHVVAAVYQRGKDIPKPTHMMDMKTGKKYPVVDGDSDDDVGFRHEQAGLKHGHAGHGVVSGLMLKGVKNEDAGDFANKVDSDGIIRINK